MDKLNFLLFGVYPYIATTILIVGSWARFDLSQYTWKTQSSQMLSPGKMRVASNLFHIGVMFIFAGHLVGLLTPHWLYEHLISSGSKQLLAMVSGGFFGFLALIGLSMLTWRRLTDARVRRNSSVSDILVLIVLLVQLVLGLATIVTSTQHLDGATMMLLGAWAQDIATFRPYAAVESIAETGLIYKTHILLGLTLFVLFPFTRLVHMLSAPIWYLGRRYQIVRQRG